MTWILPSFFVGRPWIVSRLWGSFFILIMTLELYPVRTNIFTKKRSYKKSLVGPNNPSSLKIIFVLLAKVVVVYIQITIIHIQHFSPKKWLALCQRLSKSLVWLQVGLHELFGQFIDSIRSKSQSGTQSKTRSTVTRQSKAQKGRDTIRREVLTREITRTGTFKSHLDS